MRDHTNYIGWVEAGDNIIETLREVMSEEFANYPAEVLEEIYLDNLGSMSMAEAFNFTKAFEQAGKGAGKLMADPVAAQIARTALPVAGGVAGTALGGPGVGTVIGSRLGNVAASSMKKRNNTINSQPNKNRKTLKDKEQPKPDIKATGSQAAAQALVLTQQPDVLKSLMAVALGSAGKKDINGVPVTQVMSLLSQVFGQAAADADELLYAESTTTAESEYSFGESADNYSVYSRIIDNENMAIAESELE